MTRLENLDKIINKQIKSIDEQSVNCITITFDDDTSILLEVESVYPSIGLYGIGKYEC